MWKVFKIIAEVGDDVEDGDTIIVLEAMKMENDVLCHISGKVESILVSVGDQVNSDDIIAIQTVGKEKDKFFISTNGGKDPLFIVDDKEVTKKDLDLDPNNIESVNVLKGEAATKLYGEKGKDGVVVITTKKKKD